MQTVENSEGRLINKKKVLHDFFFSFFFIRGEENETNVHNFFKEKR